MFETGIGAHRRQQQTPPLPGSKQTCVLLFSTCFPLPWKCLLHLNHICRMRSVYQNSRLWSGLRSLLSQEARLLHSLRRPPVICVRRSTAVPFVAIRNKVWSSPWPTLGTIDNCIYNKITESIQQHAKDEPDRKALISAENPSKSYTYVELLHTIESIEGFLHENGFKNGGVVVSVLPNCIEFPAIFTATIGRGGIFSGASPQFAEYEIQRQLEDSNGKIVFTTAKLLDRVVNAAAKVPSVTKVVCIDKNSGLPNGVVAWDSVVSTKTKAPLPNYSIEDVAVLPYSSGTTGVPKGVQLSHINFLTAVLGFKRHAADIILPQAKAVCGDFEPSGNQLMYLPFYHVYGKVTLTAALLKGDTVVVMEKFNPTVFLEGIQKYKIWNLYLVPPIAIFLAKSPETANYDLSSVRFASCGAAPLGAELAETFMQKFPHIFLTQAFGMSETALCSFLPPCDKKETYASVGKVAPDFLAKVVDLDDGRELDENETGELCVKGQAIMKGYLNRPEETDKVIDKDGWFHTGDIGFFNEHGEMHIVDRKKELIKVKGLQVAPAELESLLASCPRIRDVAVIGVPHDVFGEVPRAYVVRGDTKLTEDCVKKLVEEKLASYKRLEGGVIFVEQIPKSPAGKILRRELRELA